MEVKQNSVEKRGNLFGALIKGALISLSITLISICIFAFVLRFIEISDMAIKPINMIIKIISILLGTFWGLKHHKDLGFIKGLLIGLLYTVISFLVFSLLSGSFEISTKIINDLLFGGILGAISGIICVNLKKK